VNRCLRVINWEKFQHYKHRSPPWIKLHCKVLDNAEFTGLSQAGRLHLFMFWLIAARTGNAISCQAHWLKLNIGLGEEVDFQELIDADFIECHEDCTAKCIHRASMLRTNACPETETEREPKTEHGRCKSPTPKIPKSASAIGRLAQNEVRKVKRKKVTTRRHLVDEAHVAVMDRLPQPETTKSRYWEKRIREMLGFRSGAQRLKDILDEIDNRADPRLCDSKGYGGPIEDVVKWLSHEMKVWCEDKA